MIRQKLHPRDCSRKRERALSEAGTGFLKQSLRRRDDRGFTLLELLVVLAILGLLAAVVGPQVIRYLGSSRTQTSRVQVKNIAASLELFKLDVGRYPTTAEGLSSLVASPTPAPGGWNGPYLPQASALNDPWGHQYHFLAPGKHGETDVWTLGSDNVEGGSGEASDVGNW